MKLLFYATKNCRRFTSLAVFVRFVICFVCVPTSNFTRPVNNWLFDKYQQPDDWLFHFANTQGYWLFCAIVKSTSFYTEQANSHRWIIVKPYIIKSGYVNLYQLAGTLDDCGFGAIFHIIACDNNLFHVATGCIEHTTKHQVFQYGTQTTRTSF